MCIIVVSLYMSCDAQSNSIHEEYPNVLNELELLLYKVEYDEIFLTGDWNTDFNRNDMQIKQLSNFVNRSKLFVIPTEVYVYISDGSYAIKIYVRPYVCSGRWVPQPALWTTWTHW